MNASQFGRFRSNFRLKLPVHTFPLSGLNNKIVRVVCWNVASFASMVPGTLFGAMRNASPNGLHTFFTCNWQALRIATGRWTLSELGIRDFGSKSSCFKSGY